MKRIDRYEAANLAQRFGFPLGADFHSLGSATVEKILAAADFRGYRKPRNAPGSRARSFYEYLNRAKG